MTYYVFKPKDPFQRLTAKYNVDHYRLSADDHYFFVIAQGAKDGHAYTRSLYSFYTEEKI